MREKGKGVGRWGGGVGKGKGTGKLMRTHLSKLPFSKLLFSFSLSGHYSRDWSESVNVIGAVRT